MELVLHDEPECEPAAHECVGALEVDVLEQVERALAHVVRVCAHGLGAQGRQTRAVRPRAPERLVDVPMDVAGRRRAAEVLQDPELLEVRDVGKAPHERRRERGDLRGELVVGDRLEHRVGSVAGALHDLPDLDSRGHSARDYRRFVGKG